MSNRGLLTIISVILLGIFTVVVIEANEQTPAERVSESMSNAINDVSGEITNE